jgi:hypothetical protein
LTAANTSILYPCSIVNNASDSEVVIANISSLLATSFNITVANTFTNPASTYPQAYFTFITYSELNTEIERSPSFPTTYLTITQPAAFISFTVTRTSARNSDKANYTLAFNQPSLFQTTAVNTLTLGFPPEVDLSSASCANCTVSSSSSRITVMLDNSILTNSTSFNFTVLDVVNAPSFQPPSSNFSATTVINANYYYSSASAPDNYLQTINSQPADILLTNATAFSNFKVAQADSLTVVISNSNNVYYYFLALNPQLIVQNITCSVPSNFSWAFNPALHSLTLNRTNPAIAFPSSFTFVVAGFTNPVISSTQSVPCSLSGYSASNYLVSQYSGSQLSWSPACDFPCETCNAVNRSLCLSCIVNASISAFPYYYAAQQVCLGACYSTQILSGGQCFDCTNHCLECSGSASRCTACNTLSVYAYYYNFSCLNSTSCPLVYYADSTYNCLPCPFPCSTCVNASQCFSCALGAYWYGSNCVSACPANSTIANTVNNTCDPCSTICATCLGSTDNCSTCGANTVRFNGSCLTNCTPPNYVYLADCVSACLPPCLTCQVMATYCLSCLPNATSPLFLFAGQCLSSCPSGFVVNPTTYNCDSCSSLNLSCSYCSPNKNCSFFAGPLSCAADQLYSCLKCDSGFTFYFNSALAVYQCLTVLPDGYVSLNFVAEPCDATCLTCSNFTTNCIYCSTLKLFSGNCVSACPDGFYPRTTTITFNSANHSTLVCAVC